MDILLKNILNIMFLNMLFTIKGKSISFNLNLIPLAERLRAFLTHLSMYLCVISDLLLLSLKFLVN